MDSPVVKTIVIVLAVVGAVAIAGVLAMFLMHGSMMGSMSCATMGAMRAHGLQDGWR